MTTNPNIILGLQRHKINSPMEMYQAKAQIDQNELANRLGAIKVQEYEQGQADNALLRDTYKKFGADTSANVNALYGAGLGKEAGAYAKSQTEQQKAAADMDETKLKAAKTRFEMIGQGLGYLKDNPSMENAQSLVQGWVQSGLMPQEVAQQKLADFQKDPTPQGIQRLATMGYQGALDAAKQLPTFQTRNTGGTTDTLSINPVTGKVAVANSVRNTQSPESIASNATAMRGQNMADSRARDNTAAVLSKPFEITGEDGKPVLVQQDKQGNIKPVQGYTPKQGASKPLTDSQSKALLFGSRMQEAGSTIDELAGNGVMKSIPGSRAGYGVGATINALQPQDRQRLDQAKRDFINAVLRRESGAVISDAEFANAEQQYFPQPGEGPDTMAQKKRAREVANRGILAEVPDAENRVKAVRGSGAPAQQGPKEGAVQDGYRFKGGNPSDPKSWEKV